MLILLIILIVLLLGVQPRWPYSREWGYYPTGGVGVILLRHYPVAVGILIQELWLRSKDIKVMG